MGQRIENIFIEVLGNGDTNEDSFDVRKLMVQMGIELLVGCGLVGMLIFYLPLIYVVIKNLYVGIKNNKR